MKVDSPESRAESRNLVAERFESGAVDVLEARLRELPQAEMPVRHAFTPGFYVRQIFIPAGTLLTSKIHRTRHPFVITRGDISVWTKQAGVQRFSAPHTGITEPGTRRVLFAHAATVWTTFHATELTDLEAIEAELILPHVPGAGIALTDEESAEVDEFIGRCAETFALERQKLLEEKQS